MELIRAFIAFPIPETLRERLGKAQQQIMQNLTHLRPVKPQGIHLTLNFLGDISESKVYTVGGIMEQVCANHGPMELLCRRVGAFPDMKNPRVLWAGLEGEIDKLAALQKELSTQLAVIGYTAENRPFNPHLTLFRIKQQKQVGTLRKRAEKVSKENFGEILCNTLVLYRSDLKPEGAVYTKLKMVALD